MAAAVVFNDLLAIKFIVNFLFMVQKPENIVLLSCFICFGEVRQLVCMCLQKGWAFDGALKIGSAFGITCKTIETVNQAQHIRHEYVCNGESAD